MWRLRWLKSTFKIPSDLVLAIARTHLSAASKGGLNANPQPTRPTLNQHDNVCFTPKGDIAERDRHVRFLPIADIDVSLRGRTKGRSLVPFVRQFFPDSW